MHAYLHIQHTHNTHTDTDTHTGTHRHTDTHATHTHTRTHIHTHARTYTHTGTHTHTHMQRARTHTHTHLYAYTCCTQARKCIHAHTCVVDINSIKYVFIYIQKYIRTHRYNILSSTNAHARSSHSCTQFVRYVSS